jgi:hypothetical protein
LNFKWGRCGQNRIRCHHVLNPLGRFHASCNVLGDKIHNNNHKTGMRISNQRIEGYKVGANQPLDRVVNDLHKSLFSIMFPLSCLLIGPRLCNFAFQGHVSAQPPASSIPPNPCQPPGPQPRIETCTRAFPLQLPMDPDDPSNSDRGSNNQPLGPCRKQRKASNRHDCGVNAVIAKRLVSPSFREATQAVLLSWAVI